MEVGMSEPFWQYRTELCEGMRRRNVDVCCLQEVKVELALWVSKDGDVHVNCVGQETKKGIGGIGILVKERLSEKMVEVRRKSE